MLLIMQKKKKYGLKIKNNCENGISKGGSIDTKTLEKVLMFLSLKK